MTDQVDQVRTAEIFTIEAVDRELIARGARELAKQDFVFGEPGGVSQWDVVMGQLKDVYRPGTMPPLNDLFKDLSTRELVQWMQVKTQDINQDRGIWCVDDRKDIFEVDDEAVKRNASSVAAVCMAEEIKRNSRGGLGLKTRGFRETFNLSVSEPFFQQPVLAGPVCTGFLVAEDIIVTAAHFANERNVQRLRVVFDFRMTDGYTPATSMDEGRVYKGVEILGWVHDPMGSGADWALVKLDRVVEGQTVVRLSEEEIFEDQPVYVIGHPMGLPLKYAPGAEVLDVYPAWFSANLDIYSGNSGSPVFCADTHEVVGIVVRGDNRDLRYTDDGWISVIYRKPGKKNPGAGCTRAGELLHLVNYK